MLEHLSGPFPVVDSDGAPIILNSISGVVQPTIYKDDIGLISHASSGSFTGYTVIQIDGVARYRANVYHAYTYIPDIPGDEILAKTNFNRALCRFDKRAGVVGEAVLGSTASDSGLPTSYVMMLGARLPDRYLRVNNSSIKYTSLDDPTVETDEYTISGGVVGVPTISATEFETIICLIYPSGVVVYYDWVLREEVMTRKWLPVNNGAWFSTKFRVFVILDSDGEINVYANTARPSSLSSPVALSPLLKGKMGRVQVRLLGSNGEPCIGETVEWEIEGSGSLSNTRSKTDSNGYAEVTYVAPLNLTTNPLFTATVKF